MASVRIAFDRQVADRIRVDEPEPLQEHEQIWVWDCFYASMLHELGGETAESLRETIDSWAVQMASKVHIPTDKVLAAGLDRISGELVLVEPEGAIEPGGAFVVQARAVEGGWPEVGISGTGELDADRIALGAVALAQYFIGRNPLFLKELPIHALSLRKYYTDVMPPADPASVHDAPLYALNKVMEYYREAGRSIN